MAGQKSERGGYMFSCLKSPAKAVELLKSFFTAPSRLQRPWTPESVLNSYGDTPDMIIAAHVIKDLTDNFDKWGVLQGFEACYSYIVKKHKYNSWSSVINRVLYNKESDLNFAYDFNVHRKPLRRTFFVNGVKIDDTVGVMIYEVYGRLEEEWAMLKAAEAQAKRKMEENEAKWNLAETLLGMRRNENGALVPVEKEGSSTSLRL